MPTNSKLARIWGSGNDAIYLAPIGTPLPENLDDTLAFDFEDVGWLHSDGITETFTGSVEKLRGHQGNGVVRTRVSEPGMTISFTALETKEQTRSLRYHEKEVERDGIQRVARVSSSQVVSPRAAVIDLFDADDLTVRERYVIERLEITPNGDRVANASDLAAFPFTGEIIGDLVMIGTDLEAVGS